MEGAIGTLIIVILMIVAHIIKAIREGAAMKQQKPDTDEDELVIIPRPSPEKLPKPNKPRSLVRQPLGTSLTVSDSSRRQTLSKKLSPQGEGARFTADPGTLDATRIVAPTIDPTVKPELESITGIYEEGATFTERSTSALTLNIGEFLAKPEGIVQAVLFAEILNPIHANSSPTNSSPSR